MVARSQAPDIENFLGTVGEGGLAYQELRHKADVSAAAERWPLLKALQSPASDSLQGNPHRPPARPLQPVAAQIEPLRGLAAAPLEREPALRPLDLVPPPPLRGQPRFPELGGSSNSAPQRQWAEQPPPGVREAAGAPTPLAARLRTLASTAPSPASGAQMAAAQEQSHAQNSTKGLRDMLHRLGGPSPAMTPSAEGKETGKLTTLFRRL